MSQHAAVQFENISSRLDWGTGSHRAGVSAFSNHSIRRYVAMCVMKTAHKKATICAVLSLVDLSGCATLRDRNDPLTVVRQKFAAFDRHDTPAIQNLYAVDAVLSSPDYPELHGNAQIGDTYQRLLKAIPDARDEVQSIDLSGQKVYAQFLLIGHWMGSADKPIRVPILSVYIVRDGHIVADTTYYDRKAL